MMKDWFCTRSMGYETLALRGQGGATAKGSLSIRQRIGTLKRSTTHVGIALFAPLALLASVGCSTAASPWPQWAGPQRNFNVPDAKIADKWPDSGPPVLWKRPLGAGFSSIVGDGKTLYTMYRNAKDQEVVAALAAKDGQTLWEYANDAPFVDEGEKRKHNTEFGKGPQSTPLIAGDRLFTIGYTAKMHCIDRRTGKPLWTRDLLKEGGTFHEFGYAASPLAYKDTVIVPHGAKGKGQGLVSLNQADGKVVWKSTDDDASYSSPVIVDVEGKAHLLACMATDVVGVDPDNGVEQWRIPYGNTEGNWVPSPIDCGDGRVYFVNNGEDRGGCLVQLKLQDGRVSYQQLWRNPKIRAGLANATPYKGYIFSNIGGRTDILLAVNMKDGEIDWQERDYNSTKTLVAGDMLIVMQGKGALALARPTYGAPESQPADATKTHTINGLDIRGKAQVLGDKTWTPPTLIDGRLYLRDNESIMAMDLRP